MAAHEGNSQKFLHRVDVGEIIQLDVKVPIKDVTVWIDPLDATQEYTGNYWLPMRATIKSFCTESMLERSYS